MNIIPQFSNEFLGVLVLVDPQGHALPGWQIHANRSGRTGVPLPDNRGPKRLAGACSILPANGKLGLFWPVMFQGRSQVIRQTKE